MMISSRFEGRVSSKIFRLGGRNKIGTQEKMKMKRRNKCHLFWWGGDQFQNSLQGETS
jgi:hypothetical protein